MERVHEKEREYRKGDSGPKYMIRGPRFEWGIMRLKQGERMGRHEHREVEETFFFFDGSPKLIVNGDPVQVEEGEAFRLDPGEKHDILNDTDKPVRIVFIKVPYLPDDKVTA